MEGIKMHKRLFVRLTIIIVTIFAVMFMFMQALIQNVIDTSIRDTLDDKKQLAISAVLDEMHRHQAVSMQIANTVGITYKNTGYDDYWHILERTVKTSRLTLGTGIWFEPYAYDADKKMVGPFVIQQGETLIRTEAYAAENYNYFEQDWYKAGKEAGGVPVNIEPFVDTESGKTIITSSVAITDATGAVVGVAASDMDLGKLKEYISKLSIGTKGTVFLLDSANRYIVINNADKAMSPMLEDKDPFMSKVAERLAANDFNDSYFQLDNKIVSLTELNDAVDWRIGFIADKDEAGAVYSLITIDVVAVALILICLIILVLVKLQKALNRIIQAANQFRQGNFEVEIEHNREDEIGQLYDSFNLMLSEIKDKVFKLSQIANRDQLTGLSNRRHFNSMCLELKRTDYMPLCVMSADLNKLKFVNDTFGHVAGDDMLVVISKILTEIFPPDSIIARTGGDEFSLLVPNTDRCKAQDYINQVNDRCRSTFVEPYGNPSIALGFVIMESEHEALNDALHNADLLMYKDKRLKRSETRVVDR